MKILTEEQRLIAKREAGIFAPSGGEDAMLEAQAHLTLQEVGEWFRENDKMIIDACSLCCPADIAKFERGEMPGEGNAENKE